MIADAEQAGKDVRLRRFLRQWTAKESLVKATGRGLHAGQTRRFSVCTLLTPLLRSVRGKLA
jgi:phosphopantetheinyl transferase